MITMDSLTLFKTKLNELDNPKVLELGTGRWDVDKPTHHKEFISKPSTYVMSDIFNGIDFDVVADAHDLSPFSDNEFDVFVAFSVWEHLRKPWIAAQAAHRVLKPGGILFVATHQTFPVHGYPSDYCRWTDEGLKALFDEPDWTNQVSEMTHPCVIVPPPEITIWSKEAPAFLNVNIFAVKS
jgi:SAM-dependent methyltransferase